MKPILQCSVFGHNNEWYTSNLKIIEKVAEGAKNGSFELGIHGWNHEDFTELSKSEQKSTLQMANKR